MNLLLERERFCREKKKRKKNKQGKSQKKEKKLLYYVFEYLSVFRFFNKKNFDYQDGGKNCIVMY